MNHSFQCRSLYLLLILASGPTLAAQSASDADRTAPARWNIEDTSPAAQYHRSTREAHAAYREAVTTCNQMPAERKSSCLQEAKANLQNDLAFAKQSFNRARQIVPLSSPEARYNNAMREAYAAYEDSSKTCSAMTGEGKDACMTTAKARLEKDLAFAKARRAAGPESEVRSSSAAR
jgi:hypothetical protein